MGDGQVSQGHNMDEVRSFSVVLAPTATLAVQGGAFIRYLRTSYGFSEVANDFNKPSRCTALSNVVIAIRAQPCTLHLFCGRRLRRVINFSSPIVDVAGLPWSDFPADTLCVVVCRDGRAYELPAEEVLQGRAPPDGQGKEECGGTPHRKRHHGASSLDIFDELVPTMGVGGSSRSYPQLDESHADKGNRSAVTSGPMGGLIIHAKKQWVTFSHFGAKLIVTCPGPVAAVTGIVDRTSFYGVGAGARSRTSRRIAVVQGVDGAAPMKSSIVWMERGQEDKIHVGNEGIALPPNVFSGLFGAEVAMSDIFSHSPVESSAGAAAGTRSCSSRSAGTPAVMLVGDEAGVVRWAPLSPSPGIMGGVLGNLKQGIVEILPQVDPEARAIGVIIVGVKGAILSLTVISRRSTKERGQRVAADECKQEELTRKEMSEYSVLPQLRQRRLKLPFPVATACVVPGFIIHSHAGALFASALPEVTLGLDEREDNEPSARATSSCPGSDDACKQQESLGASCRDAIATNSFSDVTALRSIRLPVPCETVDIAVAQALVEDEPSTEQEYPTQLPRMIVVSLSERGRLLGFLAPQSVDELESWSLDTGKGGVRVGGSAGVERRVRCQLERLSSVGSRCASLSAESAARDREIGVLRGASKFVSTFVTAPSGRHTPEGDGVSDGDLSCAVSHSVSMEPDREAMPSMEDGVAAESGMCDALHVQLRVRLWTLNSSQLRSLPGPGEEGRGRWFVVSQLLSDAGTEGNKAIAEGWAWSVSAPLPIAHLRQGREWVSSTSLTLPSARPISVTTWLQFRFNEDLDGRKSSARSTCETLTSVNGHRVQAVEAATGLCAKLGMAQFDILDWGVTLPSVPGSDAAIRAAARGRGNCFCGPNMIISDVLDDNIYPDKAIRGPFEVRTSITSARAPASLGRFSAFVASEDCDASTLLAQLVNSSKRHSTESRNCSTSASGRRYSTGAEVAIRVGGQIVALRLNECGPTATVRESEVDGRRRMRVEVSVVCSHEAMAPLVRQALFRRVHRLSMSRPGGTERVTSNGGTGGGLTRGGVAARADAASRLSREVHSLRQACAEASDMARNLDVARARDGPQWESAREALALMGRVNEIYQTFRRQQEGGAIL